MRRRILDGGRRRRGERRENLLQLRGLRHIYQGIVGRRPNAHAFEHVEPAQVIEQIAGLQANAARAPIQIDARLQRIGERHVSAVTPELAVVARTRAVVQNDEIANALEFVADFSVVRIDVRLREPQIRKMLEQLVNAAHHEMNTRRFQGFDETRGETERHAIAVPEQLASAGHEAQQARFGARFQARLCREIRECRAVLDVMAGIHVAIADAVL